MSIIFQLFSAEDLQKLSHEELLELRITIIRALTPPSEEPPAKLESLKLNLEPKTSIDGNSPDDLQQQQDKREWVNKVLLKRFYEVSHQLKTPPSDLPQPSFDFKDLIRERNGPKNQQKEELILEWAISCELNHIEFYDSLRKARDAAYDFFENKMRARMGRFKITEESLNKLKAESVSDDLLEKLKEIKDKEVIGEKEFLELIVGTIGKDKTDRNQELILEHATMTPQFREKDPDSAYSPFNPRHPLYKQYSDL